LYCIVLYCIVSKNGQKSRLFRIFAQISTQNNQKIILHRSKIKKNPQKSYCIRKNFKKYSQIILYCIVLYCIVSKNGQKSRFFRIFAQISTQNNQKIILHRSKIKKNPQKSYCIRKNLKKYSQIILYCIVLYCIVPKNGQKSRLFRIFAQISTQNN